MRKSILFIITAFLFLSCTERKSGPGTPVEEPKGSRDFKIQGAKPAFKVSLFGVHMGTPDYEAVWSVIDRAKTQGLIDGMNQFATPVEGGVAHCIEVLDSSVRVQLLEDLKNAHTSLEESHYSIESIDACSN